jgi:hypothetical protein
MKTKPCKTLVDRILTQRNQIVRPILYDGETRAVAPYNNVKAKVAYLRFKDVGVILFKDGTWSVEDITCV